LAKTIQKILALDFSQLINPYYLIRVQNYFFQEKRPQFWWN